MKRSEFRALIREEIKRVIAEQPTRRPMHRRKKRIVKEAMDPDDKKVDIEESMAGGDYLTAVEGILAAVAAITVTTVPGLMSAYKEELIDAIKAGKDAVVDTVNDIIDKEKS